MAPSLIALAAGLVPDLLRLVARDRTGTLAAGIGRAVRDAAGTDDPAAVREILDADPALPELLRTRLAALALHPERAAAAAQSARTADQLDALRETVADVAAARDRMGDLARLASPLAWGPAAVSALVVLGFFAVVVLLVTLDAGTGASRFDPQVASVINITVGSLGAAFAAVVNFWIGSSQGSREKDAIVGRLRDARDAAPPRSAPPAPTVLAPTLPQPVAPRPTPPTAEDRFDRCLAIILSHEGGFSNDPRDPGGATNLGITLATLSAFREAEATVDDVRALTRAEAREIYRSRYWTPLRCEALPPGLDLSVLDFGVNAGPRRAARLLQRVVGVVQDGSIGPVTLAALAARRPDAAIAAFAEGRMEHYRSLPTFGTFGRGWANRTDAVRRESLAMVAASSGAAARAA